MLFYLTTLSLQKFFKEDVPVLPDENPENEHFLVIKAWKHSDFLYKNYILSGLEDDLYNVYSGVETSKELWIALERKYETKNGGLKKFVAAKFLDYKMVDSKSVIIQVHELQVIIHDLFAEGISRINIDIESSNFSIFTNRIFIKGLAINEAFQVAAIIEKLPHLWKDLKNYLKHKCKEMSLEDLIVRLRIEEDNKAAEKRGRGNSPIMGANIVDDTPQNKRKRKRASGPKSNPSKKRFNENYYNCGKGGHKSTECRAPKKD
ncbi:uncharacterized protein [Nicotiana sylvestris]|uniref:uncharacterized protein n=1 Tax=Nicotiana sylvestris TaxID=4096 RepID=UPI00388C8050